MKKILLTLVGILTMFGIAGAKQVTDVLNNANCEIGNGSGYATHEYTGTSGAKYTLQCAGSNYSIQLRTNGNDAGVVVTNSPGKIVSVEIAWNSSTTAARTLNLYTSEIAYTAPSQLFASGLTTTTTFASTAGTQKYTFSNQPSYFGVRSSDAALYLETITVVWEIDDTAVTLTPAGLSFPSSSYSARVGEAFTAPELTKVTNETPTYKSSETSVATVNPSTGAVTIVAEGTTVISASTPANATYEAGYAEYTLTVSPALEGNTIVETLVPSNFELTSSYAEHTYTSPTTGITYNAYAYKGTNPESIQIRSSSSDSGITVTENPNGYKVLAIELTQTSASQIDIYGKDEAYTNPKDLFNSANAGTKEGSISVTNGSLDFNNDAEYWGLRSNNGARYITEIKVTYALDANAPTPAGMSFPAESYNAYLGGNFTAPTLTKATDATVTYTSSNDKVAKVDANTGAITIVALGQATITATAPANNTYAAGTASYTLNVVVDGVYTVAQALEAIGNDYNGNAQVKGYISKIDEISTSYGNATYWIVDVEGTESPALEIYRGYSLNGDKFAEEDEIEVGGLVTVEGTILNYNGTPEFTTGSKIISYEAPAPVAKGVTINFTGAEDAYKLITVYDGYEPINLTGNSFEYAYSEEGQLVLVYDSSYKVTISSADGLTASDYNTYFVSDPEDFDGESMMITFTLWEGALGHAFNINVEAPVVEPEPAYSVTFNFTGVEDAYKYVGIIDMFNTNGPETLELTSNELVWKYDDMFVFNISPADPESQYIVSLSCDEAQSASTYVIQSTSANGFTAYQLAVYTGADGYVFNVNVSKPETPEVTINFTGAYQDNLKFAVMGMQQDITSGSYTLDLSDIEDDDYPYVLSFQVPEGYSVEITGTMEQSPSTWQEMSVGQAANGVSVGIFGPGAAGLELTANVTAEAEEIPADAYVVYYDGEVASNINQYDWWNASWNAQAMNPDGVGMAFEFKAADGGAAASMGLAGATAEVVGKLHNATLNFDWYAVGTGSYKLQLTGGGKNYFYEINPADVPAGTGVAWNSVSIDIATQWPELAEAWNVNTAKDEYLFAVLLSDGTEGDAIYFNKIYYTNVDESWTAPEAPAPETVPAPEQPQDMMLSFVTQYGQESYNVGGWGQSTQAENTTIDGKPVIAMTNFNYLGLVDFDINISDYDYMHVDYWTNSENTPFGFVPISLNPTKDEPIWNAETVKANEWNSYDVALSFWENVDMTSIEQIKFVANQQGGTTPYGYIANVYFWKEEVAEPNVLTLNITGGDNAWSHVNVYNVQDEEVVILLENTYSITNYAKGQVLSIQAKEGYQVEVTCATEGLIENKDYQIISQDQNGVVSYLIGMARNDVDVIFNAAVTELVIPEVTFTFTGVENAWQYVNIWDAANSEPVGLAGETVSFPNNVNQLLSISAKDGYEITIECTTEGLEADKDYQIHGNNLDGITQYTVGGFKQGIDINFDVNVTPVAPKLVTVNLTGDYEDNVIFVVSVGDDSEVITENPYSLNLNNYEDDEFPIILTFQTKEEGISIDVTGNMEQSQSTWQEMSVGQAMNGVNIAIWGPDAAGLELTAFVHEAIDTNMYLGITTDGTAPTEYNEDYVLTTKDGGLNYTGKVKINAGESFNLWYNTMIQTTDVEDQPVNNYQPMGPATDEEVVITFTNSNNEISSNVALTTFGFWTLGNDIDLELTINFDVEGRKVTMINNTEIPVIPLNTLVFEDWTMNVSKNQTTPETAEVPVSLDVDEPFAYQGFQFDIQLPAGLELVDPITLNAALNGSVSFSCVNETNNVYRVIAHSEWAEDGYDLTEDLVTLTVATTYPSEDGLATLIASGDYDVTITNIDFSTALGDDMDDFEDFTGTVTIVNAEVPATDITINSVTLNKPSYTTPSSNMVEEVVQGESVTINATVLPENTTDEVTADADNGATVESVEFDEETGTWNIVVNTDEVKVETGQEVTVIITLTAGDQEETYELTVKGILLGDSNNNGVVTVADVVTTANYMVDSPVETFCFPNANVMLTPVVDGEQVIDASDLSATINIVLDNFDGKRQVRRQAGRVATNDRLVSDNFKVVNDKPFVIGVNLDNTYDYSVLQATVEVPEGMKVLSVEKGPRAAAHELTFNHLENGTVKVVLYSLANEAFSNGEGSLFNLVVTADSNCGNLNIVDILASDERSFGYDLSYDGGLNESNTTGIDGLDAEEGDVRYFTVDGLEVVNPQPGQIVIRVQNGNATKVLVK